MDFLMEGHLYFDERDSGKVVGEKVLGLE